MSESNREEDDRLKGQVPLRPGTPPASNPARPLSFKDMAMPLPHSGDGGTGTVVGMGRVVAPYLPAQSTASAAEPEPGGTMVGMGRVIPVQGAGAASDPQGTMVGMGRVMPVQGGEASSDPHGTMVGMGRVMPVQGGGAASDPQGTMVGMGRVIPVQGAGAASDPQGTMVGMGRVIPVQGAGAASDPQGTMVGMGRVMPPAPRPSGPPRGYEIVGHLGGGALGQVFQARHRQTGDVVALRIIRPDIVSVPGAIDALRDVAQMTAHLAHTHLAKLLALDETGSPTLVLEYVTGKKLSTLMQERGAAPSPAVIDLGVRLCSGLAALHAAGLAHGRVHADNVILEAKTGRWVLLDMAQGYCVQALAQADDLHALGALLYRLATGRNPFETSHPVPPKTHVPTLSTGLSAVILRSLAPDPSLRFTSAVEMAQALVRAKSMP